MIFKLYLGVSDLQNFPQVQEQIKIMQKYVGVVLAGWEVKIGEREEVACVWFM